MSLSATTSVNRRAILRLSLSCSNRCLFCAQDGVAGEEAVSEADLAAALAGLRREHDEISLVGGEPSLSPLLPQAIAQAKALGFNRIGLQSNGGSLGDPGVLGGLVQRGLSDLHITVLGAEPTVHDYHTGRVGSFVGLMNALHTARSQQVLTVATTLLTRSNFRVLGGIPALLRSRGVVGWCVALPHARGRAERAFDRLVPRLGLAVPFALHAVEGARRQGLPSWVRGAPLCTLGPLGDRAFRDDEPRSFASVCDGCAARSACVGLDPTYVRRFGETELSRQESAPAESSAPAVLRRIFVGAGEMAPLEGAVAARLESPRLQPLPVIG